jgi:hypothetical protein
MDVVTKVDYHQTLRAFLDRLRTDLRKTHMKDRTFASLDVFHETGRKFDKVIVRVVRKNGTIEEDVRYFVNRDRGIIWGAKSPLAPNFRWYFGTIWEAHLWSWGGFHGEPKDPDKAGVKLVSEYDRYKHYQPVEA